MIILILLSMCCLICYIIYIPYYVEKASAFFHLCYRFYYYSVTFYSFRSARISLSFGAIAGC